MLRKPIFVQRIQNLYQTLGAFRTLLPGVCLLPETIVHQRKKLVLLILISAPIAKLFGFAKMAFMQRIKTVSVGPSKKPTDLLTCRLATPIINLGDKTPCERVGSMNNPYYRPEDTQPGPFNHRLGSYAGAKCPRPQGSHWNNYKTLPGGQEPKSRWNQGEIPATDEEAQNTQTADVFKSASGGDTEIGSGQPGQLQAANVVTGDDEVLSNQDLQNSLVLDKRNENRIRKPFTA